MMSVAYESNTSSDSNRIQGPGFARGMWIYNSSETDRFTAGDHRRGKFPAAQEDEDSCSSSSIGKNSDASGGGGDSDEDEGEVQSSLKGPLNNLTALEEVLPVKRGISTFYAGKSKSFTSLADAASAPSIRDIAKPEDAYNRKRKNMLAHSVLSEKNRDFTSKNGLSKRFANSSRSTLAFVSIMNRPDSSKSGESSKFNSSQPSLSLPPLPAHPRRPLTNELPDSSTRLYCSPWRSWSLSDLQHAAAAATSSVTDSVTNNRDKEDTH